LALLPALGGDKAQTSGALRTDEISGSRLQSEAERVGAMNKLLRNRQFDVFRAGNSLGGAIDVPLPNPSAATIPSLDPKAQQRLMEEYDRKKNWLVEPGSVKPREVEKSDEIDAGGKRGADEEIPNFSRERGRARRSRNDSDRKDDFEEVGSDGPSKTRKGGRLPVDDVSSGPRSVRSTGQEAGRRDGVSTEAVPNRSISETLKPEADQRTWFSGSRTETSGGTFSFKSQPAGSGAEGFAGSTGPGKGSGTGSAWGNPGGADLVINPVAPAAGFDGDPGRRFDPTVAPGSPFSSPEAGFFPKSGGAAAAASPDGGFGAFGGAAGGSGVGARGFEGSVRSLFSAPPSDASSSIRSSPGFTPRPAVLSFPQSGPF
jgi:hypothetical protein